MESKQLLYFGIEQECSLDSILLFGRFILCRSEMLIIIAKFLTVNVTDVLLLYIVTVDVTDGLLLGYLNYYQTTLRIRDAHMMKLGVTATDVEVSGSGVVLGCHGWLPWLPSLAFSSRDFTS